MVFSSGNTEAWGEMQEEGGQQAALAGTWQPGSDILWRAIETWTIGQPARTFPGV